MKKFALILLAIGITLNIIAQETYKVVKVKGTIVLLNSNMTLMRGSIFDANDKIEFKSEDAVAAVMKPGEGRFILKKSNDNSIYAKANLSPAIPTMATRAIGVSSMKALKYQFQEKVFIDDTIHIYCKTRQLFKNKKDYLFIKYKYEGKEFTREIGTTKNSIILCRNALFDSIGANTELMVETELYYKNAGKDTEEHLVTFTSSLPNSEELLEEVTTIIGESSEDDRSSSINFIMGFINDFYGTIDYANTSKLYDKVKNR